jgi:hypothetical protein
MRGVRIVVHILDTCCISGIYTEAILAGTYISAESDAKELEAKIDKRVYGVNNNGSGMRKDAKGNTAKRSVGLQEEGWMVKLKIKKKSVSTQSNSTRREDRVSFDRDRRTRRKQQDRTEHNRRHHINRCR